MPKNRLISVLIFFIVLFLAGIASGIYYTDIMNRDRSTSKTSSNETLVSDSTFLLTCKNNEVTQNGVLLQPKGCPSDADNNGQYDADTYTITATNKTQIRKYIQTDTPPNSDYVSWVINDNKIYFILEAGETKLLTSKIKLSGTPLSQRNSTERQYTNSFLIVDSIDLGTVKEQKDIDVSCPPYTTPEDITTTQTETYNGLSVTLECGFDYLIEQGKLEYSRIQLKNSDSKSVFAFEDTDPLGNSILLVRSSFPYSFETNQPKSTIKATIITIE